MKFKNMLVRYGTGFLLMWLIGTLIPVFALSTMDYPFLTNFLMLVFNPIGWIIRVFIVQVLNAVYLTEMIAFLLMTFGQIITCIVYKYLLKKLFKIRW